MSCAWTVSIQLDHEYPVVAQVLDHEYPVVSQVLDHEYPLGAQVMDHEYPIAIRLEPLGEYKLTNKVIHDDTAPPDILPTCGFEKANRSLPFPELPLSVHLVMSSLKNHFLFLGSNVPPFASII